MNYRKTVRSQRDNKQQLCSEAEGKRSVRQVGEHVDVVAAASNRQHLKAQKEKTSIEPLVSNSCWWCLL